MRLTALILFILGSLSLGIDAFAPPDRSKGATHSLLLASIAAAVLSDERKAIR